MRIEKYGIAVSVFGFVLVISLFYMMYELTAGKPKFDFSSPTPPVITPGQQTTIPSPPQAESQHGYVARIKQEIISGAITEVPEDVNLTRNDIIMEYLNGCSNKPTRQQYFECTEYLFLQNDEGFRQSKQMCEDDRTCLDKLYFELAHKSYDIICEGVRDPDLREECLSTIV
jgi:hypothetical protein